MGQPTGPDRSHFAHQVGAQAPQWIFNFDNSDSDRLHQPLTRHGDPRFAPVDPQEIYSVALSIAFSWGHSTDRDFLARGSFAALGDLLGPDVLAQNISIALESGQAPRPNPAILEALAMATQESLAESTPAGAAPKGSPLRV